MRLARGGRVDRSRPLAFTFDGVAHEGLAGDTLASALLAAGVRGAWRSVEEGRPRGIVGAGSEEPNASVEVDGELRRATQVELVDGLAAASRAGRARIAAGRPRRHDKLHAHCEVLVVGGGRSGAAAAAAAVRTGDRVLLVEEGPELASPLEPAEELRVLTRTTAFGLYDGNLCLAVERRENGQRLWQIRAREVVLATGAHERIVVFEGNDLPGVMLAGAARTYVERYAVCPWRRAVVFGANDSVAEVARVLAAAGVDVAHVGRDVVRAEGDGDLRAAVLADGTRVECDLLAVSGGWNPALALFAHAQGRLRWDGERCCLVPVPDGRPVRCVGRAAGEVPASAPLFRVPGDPGRQYVDLERDVTAAELDRALGAGLRSAEHVKRYTSVGTGLDQGRTSGVVAAALVGYPPSPTTFRPPYVPVTFGAIAGRTRGELSDPARTTPLHDLHVARGAVFEDVGQWKRPRYFPLAGEDLAAAVARECRAARGGVAMLDASTLGKIELQGPDAAELLNRLYTNALDTLAVGACRYALLCKPDGMVFDDGVVMRLAEERFLATTTTGNAAAVLDWFEEWLQTEWPELRVYCTSVTEQWATVALVGPRARAVLAELTAIPVDNGSFPFMAIREGEVAGVPARVARVSFSGELAFEVNVAGPEGPRVWEALAERGVTPYGTETMHVLRAEKGYVIVGQDTDGTVTPLDLGLDWLVSGRKPDFVGRRSLARPDTARGDRKHLVGLLPERVLPEGAQVVARAGATEMLGHVTSSYESATLGRPFALALVRGGRGLVGETVVAALRDGDVPATVTAPVFYDPEGLRRDG